MFCIALWLKGFDESSCSRVASSFPSLKRLYYSPREKEVTMPSEIIGEVGTPGAEREWIVTECGLAIKHVEKVCGEPPPEVEGFAGKVAIHPSEFTPIHRSFAPSKNSWRGRGPSSMPTNACALASLYWPASSSSALST
jgi:hypothetical protein